METIEKSGEEKAKSKARSQQEYSRTMLTHTGSEQLNEYKVQTLRTTDRSLQQGIKDEEDSSAGALPLATSTKSETSADGGVGDLLSKVAFIFQLGANGSQYDFDAFQTFVNCVVTGTLESPHTRYFKRQTAGHYLTTYSLVYGLSGYFDTNGNSQSPSNQVELTHLVSRVKTVRHCLTDVVNPGALDPNAIR